ncbi:MAG: twin-arginine translocation signal domain-containing protein [Gemmatimonadaceae bacterium]|nr:twin-arginine translocation signal domain-containing protein [Gemmatimonadaceae bacterium]
MSLNRRDFLKAGAVAAVGAVAPPPLLVRLGRSAEPVPPLDDPRVKELALRALDAARAAGAAYADVRLTHTWVRGINSKSSIGNTESLAVGVRALVSGYWGFASSAIWSPDEVARLGREAVGQASTNALGKPRTVDLGPAPVVRDGQWQTPVRIDPFTVPVEEVLDYLQSLVIYTSLFPGASAFLDCTFTKQEKIFASTAGSYLAQRLYRTQGTMSVDYQQGHQRGTLGVGALRPAARGWEHLLDAPLREAVPRLIAELREDFALPKKTVDVGRYDLVADAPSMAGLLANTIGSATQIDRALGYEANAGGTSFLNDPLAMLGSYRIGAPILTVVANRSEPTGTATVKWDDEGIAPDDFPLVDQGILVDFQTTREQAAWLAPWYAKRGRPARSHGCADAPSALEAAMQHMPNLTLTPGREALDFDDLVAGVADGIAVKALRVDMDFQHLNGTGYTSRFYEIKKGKRVAMLRAAGILFRAPELWKNLTALGGPRSLAWVGGSEPKGEPTQTTSFSVGAVPGVFKDVTLIDVTRKA